jgi:hypothetical protein
LPCRPLSCIIPPNQPVEPNRNLHIFKWGDSLADAGGKPATGHSPKELLDAVDLPIACPFPRIPGRGFIAEHVANGQAFRRGGATVDPANIAGGDGRCQRFSGWCRRPYLEGLAVARLEAARNPRLLTALLGVLRLAPRTIGTGQVCLYEIMYPSAFFSTMASSARRFASMRIWE